MNWQERETLNRPPKIGNTPNGRWGIVQVQPTYDTAARGLRTVGRFDEARREHSRSLELDPLSLIINVSCGALLYLTRQYDKAIEQLQRTLELEPGFSWAHCQLGLVYEAQGMYQEAQAMYEQATAFAGEDPEMTGCFGRIAALTGKTENAQKLIEELIRVSVKREAGCCYLVAGIYAALGNRGQAFHWLETSYADREDEMAMIKVDPLVDRLRDDSRFASLLERMGFGNTANRETLEAASGGWPSRASHT